MKGVFQYNSKRNIYHRTCKIFLKFDDLRLPTFNFLLIDSIFKRNYSVILGHYFKKIFLLRGEKNYFVS
jgi:hypothetical protein